jgi:hypothetical protein
MITELFDLAVAVVDIGLLGLGLVVIGPSIVGLFADGIYGIARGLGWTCGEILWHIRRRVVGPAVWSELLSLTLEQHAAEAEIDRIATAARRRIRRIAEAGDGQRPGREVQR